MFGLFKKDPRKNLEKEYYAKLEEAMHAQRNGDIKEYSELTAEAEKIQSQIQSLTQTS
jgi:hypothetical protein